MKLKLVLLLAAAYLAAPAFVGPSRAHSWYDYSCCRTRDCEAMPAGSVRDMGSKGYRVTYASEKFGAVDIIVPRDKKKDSKDGRDHFCGYRVGADILPRCLYLSVNS